MYECIHTVSYRYKRGCGFLTIYLIYFGIKVFIIYLSNAHTYKDIFLVAIHQANEVEHGKGDTSSPVLNFTP